MTLNGMHIVKVNINFLLKGHIYVVLKQRNKLQQVTDMTMYQNNYPHSRKSPIVPSAQPR